MVTLYAYILRELLKVFALTTIAMTALFTMGGGLFNVMTQEAVSTADVLGSLHLLIPIAVTLTIPISALFSATIVYGRLAADNEFVACRSAGINIHLLFLPAILLSVFVTVVTTVSANYFIPSSVKQITRFVAQNLAAIAEGRLKTDGSVRWQQGDKQLLLTAEDAGIVPTADMRARNEQLAPNQRFELAAGISYLSVKAPTFLLLEGSEIVRFATAAWGLCKFDMRGKTATATLVIGDGRDFDLSTNTVTRFAKQPIGPFPLPIPLPDHPSWADLPTLFLWLEQPWLYDGKKVGRSIDAFIAAIVPYRLSLYCAQELDNEGRPLVLRDRSGASYEITSKTHERRVGGRLALEQAEIIVTRPGLDRPIRYIAPRAEIIARPAGGNDATVELRLMGSADDPVLEYNPRAEDYTKPIKKTSPSLDGLLLPEIVKSQMSGITRRKIIDLSVELDLSDEMIEKRIGLRRAADKFQRKVAALIHFRLGFCTCALVTVLMGAVLGVIFRGARVLAAVGLSVVPLASVALMMLMGRQLAQHAGTESVGVAIIWGGLLLVAVADACILRVAVRR
ncbi:MAG: LptF/LptG family permease [Planctomycetes bacterium]|nr:LptF/LptG family permease [Planctomycetota bacterium]